jgi:hypothetical protein
MADHYGKLTETEKGYWDVYTRLRALSDWDGFSDHQDAVKGDARDWLVNQRKQIWRQAQPKKEGGDGHGWDYNHRAERYEQLKDDKLNTGDCRRVAQLPTNGGTPGEKAGISEREMWWCVDSVDDRTKSWRQSNVDLLTQTRKQVYALAEEQKNGWDKVNRKLRWNNLCVATKTGVPYKTWQKGHNDHTGEPVKPKTTGSAGKDTSSRGKAVTNARRYLGVRERPPGSNRGDPQPSGWQRRVIGSSGYAWCACFTTCMAWDAGVVGAGTASVAQAISMAKRGVGMYRGFTTDPSKVLRGDHAVVGCGSCHIGMVASNSDPCHLIEGNTSAAGSYNGGAVAEKRRPRSSIIGWCLVDFPS